MPSTKTWEIQKTDAETLYNKIKDILDSSGLQTYFNYGKLQVLKEYSHLDRKPYTYQLEAAQFLIEKKRTILADEMGLGKTLSTILASFSLPSPRIIICPASLKLNWYKEIRTVDKEGTIKIITDDFEVADWIIINYNFLDKHRSSIIEAESRCIILDEAHYMG